MVTKMFIQKNIIENKYKYKYWIMGLVLGILGISFFTILDYNSIIIKYILIEILSVIVLFFLPYFPKSNFYNKLMNKIANTFNIIILNVFFIAFFYILNNVSSVSASTVSLTFIILNTVLNFLFGVAIVMTFIATLLNKHNIYSFISFANLFVFLNVNKILASIFIDKNQINYIFSVLFSIYILGLLILFLSKTILKRKYR